MNLRFKNPLIYDEKLGRNRTNFHALKAYGRKLNAEGWTYSDSIKGYISPDRSAVFFVNRPGYNGKVMKYSTSGNYRSTIAELQKTGHFDTYMSESDMQQIDAVKASAANFISTLCSTIPFVAVLFMMVLLN